MSAHRGAALTSTFPVWAGRHSGAVTPAPDSEMKLGIDKPDGRGPIPSASMRRLVLWDIDGTLIRGGGVGSLALTQAATTISGRRVDGEAVMMHGKTDPQIISEMFRAAAIAEDEIIELLPPTLVEAERLLAAAEQDLRARGEVIEGVRDVLDALHERPDVRQSLVTGNLVGNAAVKIAAFDLERYFDVEVGAYGTDHADRNNLVPIALERVERLRGETYARHDVWVIGDTPADFACARAASVRYLLVATGQVPIAELRACNADRALVDLTDTAQVVELLTETRSA